MQSFLFQISQTPKGNNAKNQATLNKIKKKKSNARKPKKAKGVYLVKKGVQIVIRPTWAFQILPPEGGCFWRKQPGLPGRAELAWASWVASSSPILL